MKWVTYLSPSDGSERVGVLVDNEVLGGAAGVSLIDVLRQDGPDLTQAAARLRSNPAERVPADSVKLRAPVPVPPSIRDFFGFEDHAVNSLKAYLYTVALNIAKDRQKLAAIRRRIEGIARHEFTSTSPSPEPLLSAEQRVQVLQRAIEGLRPLWREVLTLRYWDHLEVSEMVARFAQRGVDVNKRTVERWLHDAIAECRREVRAAEGDGGGK